jgi:hypothetical protein
LKQKLLVQKLGKLPRLKWLRCRNFGKLLGIDMTTAGENLENLLDTTVCAMALNERTFDAGENSENLLGIAVCALAL